MTRVTNLGHNPVEAAGVVFPSRRTIDVELTGARLAAVRAHRRLRVEAPVRLESLTVAQLRDLAGQRGLSVPQEARKPELVGLLRGGDRSDGGEDGVGSG